MYISQYTPNPPKHPNKSNHECDRYFIEMSKCSRSLPNIPAAQQELQHTTSCAIFLHIDVYVIY